MHEILTPAAGRTVAFCRRMTAGTTTPQAWCDFLILALLQDDSLAAAAMRRLGISIESLLAPRHSPQAIEQAVAHLKSNADVIDEESWLSGTNTTELNDPQAFIQILDRAAFHARRELNSTGVSSAHLLVAVFETNEMLRQQMIADGVDRERIVSELKLETVVSGPALPIDFDLNWSAREIESVAQSNTTSAVGLKSVWRIIDANLNRSREGLRVLEDYTRFVRNDAHLSQQLKTLRHDLIFAEKLLPNNRSISQQSASIDADGPDLLSNRDTANDVGTQISTSSESTRNDMSDVVMANSRRVQEALRSLEEFGKLLAPDFASSVKQIRYRTYVLQQRLALLDRGVPELNLYESRIRKLQTAVLYVLITESTCQLPWRRVVDAAVRGGADVLQLREKQLSDRELLVRAQWMADACREADRLFIVNDRPDLAVAANADGVHVGQEEFPAFSARAVLRPNQILGISTHSLQQAQLAQSDGADYIGVGPTFPTTTKTFSDFPGLELVREASRNIQVPAFAIGGIGARNLQAVLEAGGSRVALTSSVAGSADPESAVRDLKCQLVTRVV